MPSIRASLFSLALTLLIQGQAFAGGGDPAILAKGYTFLARIKAEKAPQLQVYTEYDDHYFRVTRAKSRFELLAVAIGSDVSATPFWLYEFAVDCSAPAARMMTVRTLDGRWQDTRPPGDTNGAVWQLPQQGSFQRIGLEATCAQQ